MRHAERDNRNPHSGFSLIEILVVCALLAALSAGMYSFLAGKSKPGEKARTPMERAHDPECINNLSQLRQALIMAQSSDDNGKYPQQLSDLKGIPVSFLSCPESHVPYTYDPETGTVHCTRAGHEKY
jgi:prepilin-type N-terminal cleavage/methylation domain-containing protein